MKRITMLVLLFTLNVFYVNAQIKLSDKTNNQINQIQKNKTNKGTPEMNKLIQLNKNNPSFKKFGISDAESKRMLDLYMKQRRENFKKVSRGTPNGP
ncbi:MAG: hypothetical protein AB8B59_18635, partial [Maribacter sp.]